MQESIDDVERADELLRPVLAGAVLVVDAAVATEFAEAYARATRKELFEDASRDVEELREQVAAALRAWQATPHSAANKAARQQAKDAVTALRIRLTAAEEELLHVRRECESSGPFSLIVRRLTPCPLPDAFIVSTGVIPDSLTDVDELVTDADLAEYDLGAAIEEGVSGASGSGSSDSSVDGEPLTKRPRRLSKAPSPPAGQLAVPPPAGPSTAGPSTAPPEVQTPTRKPRKGSAREFDSMAVEWKPPVCPADPSSHLRS